MVPNLYVETTCQLHRLLDSFFVVSALHNFGGAQKVTTASDGVDAIWYRHDKFPELALGVATVSRCGCRAGVGISGALSTPLMK